VLQWSKIYTSQGNGTLTLSLKFTRACKVISNLKNVYSEFQENKRILLEAFKKEHLGTWVKKPMEQDEFALEDSYEG